MGKEHDTKSQQTPTPSNTLGEKKWMNATVRVKFHDNISHIVVFIYCRAIECQHQLHSSTAAGICTFHAYIPHGGLGNLSDGKLSIFHTIAGFVGV